MPKGHVKLSAEQQRQLESIDRFDSEQAFEVGFAKAAHDMGLSQDEFARFYDIAAQEAAQKAQA